MRLFPKETEIAPTEGFEPPKDIFGRKSFGERLARIASRLETPTVLLLDAPWGSGKTTFVKMWRGELKKAGIPSVYFDAFASDYQKDAFLSVASQIIAEAKTFSPGKTLKTFKQKALQTAKVLGRATLVAGIRAVTGGLVEAEGLSKIAADAANALSDEAAKAVDEVLKEQLESHEQDGKAFEDFKTALTNLAVALSASGSDRNKNSEGDAEEANSSSPLIFIIDELDRCRPSFALEVLEKIKHFFSVPGVSFLLVCSLRQLETSVRFSYGEIDAHEYLEKFYHLRILFPIGTIGRPDIAVATYLRHLRCNRHVAEVIEEFSKINPLSLRTLERIAAYSKIVEVSLPKNAILLPQIVSILCILKVVRPKLYEDARRSKLDFGELDSLLRFSSWRDSYNPKERTSLSVRVEQWWLFALGLLQNESVSAQFVQGLLQYNLERSAIIPHFCELMDGFEFPDAG